MTGYCVRCGRVFGVVYVVTVSVGGACGGVGICYGISIGYAGVVVVVGVL